MTSSYNRYSPIIILLLVAALATVSWLLVAERASDMVKTNNGPLYTILIILIHIMFTLREWIILNYSMHNFSYILNFRINFINITSKKFTRYFYCCSINLFL